MTRVLELAASRRGFLGLAAGGAALAASGGAVQAERVRTTARIAILGAGAGGTAIANRLANRLEGATITIVDGRQQHWYQPGFTLIAAGLKSALISSTSRTPADQARIMFNNLEKYGVEHQKRLYGRSGDSVIDVYAKSRAAGKTSDQIKADMETKIKEVGPTNVSRHTGDPNVLNVFDVAPSSITDKVAFEKAVKADTRVTKFLTPPQDPGYHLEIPQPKPQ